MATQQPHPQTQLQRYQDLEQISDVFPARPSIWQQFIIGFKALGKQVIHRLTAAPEPIIKRQGDRPENMGWHVYDPYTNRTRCFESEAEVLKWLDERFYQRNSLAVHRLNDLQLQQSRWFR